MKASFPTLESLPSRLPTLIARPAFLSRGPESEETIEAISDDDILEIQSLDEDLGPSTQRSPVCAALLATPSRPVPPVVCDWLPATVAAPLAPPASGRPVLLLGSVDDEVEPATATSQDLEFSFEESGTRRVKPEVRRPATQPLQAIRRPARSEVLAPLARCG